MDLKTAQRTLQAAIDQYPRLIALNFSLSSDSNDLETSHSRFQAVFRPLLEAFINERIDAGKTAPPTQLRYIWLPTQSTLHGVLLLNQNSIWQTGKDGELSDTISSIIHLLSQVWKPTTVNHSVKWPVSSYLQLDRTNSELFNCSYRLLWQYVSNLKLTPTESPLF
ncbi:TPA: inovirus-type Gp2 protein [Kluyvera cryocrescens]|nr:inovirus-type Gp2 protein [Kluyvera cryocrescens]